MVLMDACWCLLLAAELKLDAVCVALGGLGSSFDQLAMNREMLKQNNVRLRGVILNKVNPTKMDMIKVRLRMEIRAAIAVRILLTGSCCRRTTTREHLSVGTFHSLVASRI